MFKVGDKVVVVIDSPFWYKGKEFTVDKISTQFYGTFLQASREEGGGDINDYRCKLIERNTQMTLKQRIKALNNGWDKEADDILQEIGGDYYICIKARNSESTFVRSVEIQSNVGDRVLVGRPLRYRNQCEKLSAFKQALLWLLDKSEAEKAKEGDRAEVEVDGQRFEAKLIKKL